MQRLIRPVYSIVPLLIIGGLLYAAFLVKPSSAGGSVPPAALEKRDYYYGVAIPSPTTIWAVGTFGKVVRSDDEGKSWKIQPTPVTVNLQSIAAWDLVRGVVVEKNGVVIVTKDGGKSWLEVSVPRSDVSNKFMKVRIVADGSAWAVGEMGAVLVSRDRGATWARAAAEEDVTFGDIAFVEQRAVLVGEFGRIKISENGGASWNVVNNPVKSSLTSVAFRNRLEGVAVGLDGVILETKDGGKNWAQVTTNYRQHLLDVIWDGNAWVAVGNRGTILKSNDPSGKDWSIMPVAGQASGWYTKVEKSGDRYFFSGTTLAVVENGKFHTYTQNAQR